MSEIKKEVKEEIKEEVSEIKEDLGELVTAAKKVGKTAKKVSTEKGKEVATKVKKSATKIKAKVEDIFSNTKVHTCLQVDGLEFDVEELTEKVKENYRLTSNDKEVKELNLYIKPEDNAVYYVVNGTSAGKVDIN